jgi:hypothetical protein
MRAVMRKEKKFLCDIASARQLQGLLGAVLQPDPHNGPCGYPVRSLYFDTLHDRDFNERLDGVDPRRKVRLRVYDPLSDSCMLELKQKQVDNQVKRSLPLTRDEGRALIRGDYGVLLAHPEPFAAEMHALMSINGYRPVAVVEYDRLAFIARENKIRITFDANMRATEAGFDIFDANLAQYPVFDPFNLVLEVKYNGFLLSYIRELLNTIDKSEIAVSKYLLARGVSYNYQF